MMRKTNKRNIERVLTQAAFACGGLLLFAGCADDVLYDDPSRLPSGEYVSFSAAITPADEKLTRSEKSLYEPLELGAESEEYPLYLHTYEHPAGDEFVSEEPATRGLQVESAQSLVDVHGSFGARGVLANGAEYIPLQDTKLLTAGNSTLWITNTPLRWPGSSKIAFSAIAPFDGIEDHRNLAFDTNRISFTYSALKGDGTNDAEKQKDVMMAVANLGRDETADYGNRVPLKFHHSLAAVKFAVRDVLKGKVKSITVRGVYGTGDCVFTASDNSTGGKFDWTNQRDKESYSQVFNHEIENGNFDPTDDAQDVVLTEKMPEKTFMLIPQDIPADAEIEVEIERYDVAQGATPIIKVKGRIRANVTEWRAGYEYVYTISTSKDNWVNILEVEGNEAEGKRNIYVYSPSHPSFDTYDNTGYFKVKSYRYKANDQKYIEPLPWKASHGGSLSYNIENGNDVAYPTANPQQKFVTAENWITDTFRTPLRGEGSLKATDQETHNLNFLPHYVSTNWPGDNTMQGYLPYSGFDQENPYDLSTFGGKRNRTTANCYVIDRGGWYMFPMVYGNSIKNGATNADAYTSKNAASDASLKILKTLVKHNGEGINKPEIVVPANAKGELVWQDAYDMVEHVELMEDLIDGKRMIRFHVDPNSIQQGNAVIALKNKNGTILWSWHIWATEHWLNPSTRLPHVYNKTATWFTEYKTSSIGIRAQGDVEVTYNQKGRSFMMSPYNIGYCDPKKVIYLKRKSVMEFVQYSPDGSKTTGNIAKLDIIQQGEVIDYKFANNTYYQWGRKDPMRGYFNHENDLKRVFGPSSTAPKLAYLEDGAPNIDTAIKNPHIFYVSRDGYKGSKYEDWLTTHFKTNLWNNAKEMSLKAYDDDDDHADMWSHEKTVYDPSPAGYMVPNAGVWHVVQTAFNGTWYEHLFKKGKFTQKVNGETIDPFNYKIWGKGNKVDEEALFFSSTGNRWWTGGWNPGGYDGGAGGNFGKNVSYAWSSRSYEGTTAFGMAVGLDTNREADANDKDDMYFVGGQFIGRRTMGRPVRAIREP